MADSEFVRLAERMFMADSFAAVDLADEFRAEHIRALEFAHMLVRSTRHTTESATLLARRIAELKEQK